LVRQNALWSNSQGAFVLTLVVPAVFYMDASLPIEAGPSQRSLSQASLSESIVPIDRQFVILIVYDQNSTAWGSYQTRSNEKHSSLMQVGALAIYIFTKTAPLNILKPSTRNPRRLLRRGSSWSSSRANRLFQTLLASSLASRRRSFSIARLAPAKGYSHALSRLRVMVRHDRKRED
jgi:hypothetical protein